MACEACGARAETKYVAFYQNIGLLVMRMSKAAEGNMCKSCIHKHFWEYTAINMFLGWWGMISLIITPFFIINNTVRYLCCLGMASPTQPAESITPQHMERIHPYAPQIFARLNKSEPVDIVMNDVARQSGTSPEQVGLYVQAALRSQQK